MRLITLLFFLFLVSCSGKENNIDLILYNATVLTVDAKNSVVEAVAISDGKFVATGTNQQIKQLASNNTLHIDLLGKTLAPAFVAVHEHPAISAVFNDFIDLSGFTHDNANSVWQALQQAAQSTPKGEWVYGSGLDTILISDLTLPSKQFLDELIPEHPVFLVSQSLHSFWANSLAFEQIGITKDTPNPGHGSIYEKDQHGELTGFMTEKASAPFLVDLKSPLRVIPSYQRVLQQYIDAGFTSVASLGYNFPPLAAKFAANYWTTPIIRQFFYMKEDEFSYLPDSPDNGDDYFRVLGVKLWHDGSPYTGTMNLFEPYLFNEITAELGIVEGHTGGSTIEDQQLVNYIRKYHQQGWQIAIHSQGDKSNHKTLKAFQGAITTPHDLRHRIEHGLLLPKDKLVDAKKLGLSPSFHINHIFYYGNALQRYILGKQRAHQMLAVKSSQQQDLMPTLHADSPMFPADPFSLMRTAILRKTHSGQEINPEQAITRQEALRLMTINAAWQLHMDDKLGSIESGKLADFIVLSQNPYQLPAEQWLDIQIEQVWMEGARRK
jgi:predicted amidohydrolase YtcJ